MIEVKQGDVVVKRHSEGFLSLIMKIGKITGKELKDGFPAKNYNPGFKNKFAGLPDIQDIVNLAFAANGITVSSSIVGSYVSMLVTDGTEFIEHYAKLPWEPSKGDINSYKGAITSTMRYMFGLLFNVGSDPDWDNVEETHPEVAKSTVNYNIKNTEGGVWLNLIDSKSGEVKDQAKAKEVIKWLEDGKTLEQINTKYNLNKQEVQWISQRIK